MPQIRLTTCHSDSLTKELTNAHLLSRDNQVITGKIKIEGDVISIRTSLHTNVALCLLYEVGRAGRLMLQTGILPPREEPYMLSQELARHRIKLFLDMSENWSLFYLSDDHPAIQKWEESRLIFTESLTSTDLNHADELARRALELAINASERLAMAHAHLLLHKRFGKTASSSSTLGVRINPTRFDAPLRDFLEKNINIVSLPMPWNLIEPKEGVYDWEAVDNWVKWIHQSKKFAIAGPLIDFSKKDLCQCRSFSRKNNFDPRRFIYGDILDLPFEDNSFNCVLCVRVIQHLSKRQQQLAIKELSRVLLPGGSLIMLNYNSWSL